MSETQRCGQCGATTDVNYMSTVDGDAWCERCVERYSFYCDDCDERHSDNSERHNDRVYHSEPASFPFFQSAKEKRQRNTLYLGTELEMEVGHRCGTRYELSRSLNRPWAFTKDDGSLSNGIELVTSPFTPLWLSEHLDDWRELLDVAQDGATVRDSCGMHVHMSRAAMSVLHIYKIMKLVYGNSAFFRTISGRNTLHYCSLIPDLPLARKAKNGCDSRRYQAINTQPPETIEFRLFAGTLDFDRVIGNLQLCHAMWAFTKDLSVAAVSLDRFVPFLKQPPFALAHSLVQSYSPNAA